MKTLKVAPDQTLPAAMLTDSTTIIGRKRSGKSNDAVVIVEEALDLGGQVIVIDPKGDWWGMTSSEDGKREGYGVVVVGGRHGQLALNPYAGTAVADWVITTGHSVILDLQGLEVSAIERFCSEFLAQLRRRQEERPRPVLLVIDEADELAPEDQRERIHVLKTLGRVIWSVKRGGFVGIGTLVITQRPASLNKNVLSQTEVLIVLQVTSAQDLDAVELAIRHHVEGKDKRERAIALENLLREIVKLDKGSAIVISGQLLKGIFRIPFRRRRTFDSGATPKFGEKPRQPKVTAKVALAQLTDAMAAAVEEAKASDPALLRDRVRTLEAELAKKREPKVAAGKPRDVPVLRDDTLAKLKAAMREALAIMERIDKYAERQVESLTPLGALKNTLAGLVTSIGEQLVRINATPSGDDSTARATMASAAPARDAVESRPVRVHVPAQGGSSPMADEPRTTARPRTANPSPGGIDKAKQKLLDALAWLESVGIRESSRKAVAGLAGFSPTSGSLSVHYARLEEYGLVTFPKGGHVALTATGRATANAPDAPLTAATLQANIYQRVGDTKARILRELVRIYPQEIHRVELAQRVGISPTSGSYSVHVSDLESYGFVVYPKGKHVAAAPLLFLERAA